LRAHRSAPIDREVRISTTLSDPAAPPEPGYTRLRQLVLLLAAAILVAVAPYLPGLLGSMILFVVAAPAHRVLRRWVGARFASAIVVTAMLLLLLLPGAWLISTAFAQAGDVLRWLREGDIIARLTAMHVGPIELGPHLASASTALVSWASGRTLALFGGATRATLNLIIAMFGLYYLLMADEGAWRRVARATPLPSPVVELLRVRFVEVTEALVLGTMLTALLQGALIGAAFALVGLPGPVFWGLVTALVSVLPVMGSALVWLPGTVALAAQRRLGAAAMLGLTGLVLASNIDNVVRLSVFRRVSGIHPMITLVGGFAGVGVFGFVGVLLGPLALSYFFELLRVLEGPGAAPAPLVIDESAAD
jgi:predicted PurR-regulated permease PerM